MPRITTLCSITLISFCSTSCSNGKMCTAMGCLPAFSMHIPISASDVASSALVVEVCRETECLSGTLGAKGTGVPSGSAFTVPSGATIEATHSSHIDVSLMETSSTTYRLDISWSPYDPSQLRNGDHYAVNATTSSGAVIVSATESVTYATNTPNGPECGPVCQFADVTLLDAGSN